jgi:hypothetical protein
VRTLLNLFVVAESLIRAALLAGGRKRSVRKKVRDVLTALRIKAVGTPDKPGAAWDAVAESYRQAAREVQDAQRRDANAPLGSRHQRTLERLFADLSERLDKAIAHVMNDVEVSSGAFPGEDEEIPEVKGFTDKGGKRWDLAVYARMCARTVAAQAMSEATINRLLDEGEDLVQVSSHPHPEDSCSPYEGRVYSISGKSRRYPKLREMPPFHPNCRHRLRPFRKAPAARRNEQGTVILDTRSSAVSVLEDGRVFVTPTPGVVEVDRNGRVYFVIPED